MSKEIKKSLVPKLRFPKFQDVGEWEEKQLSSILDYERPDKYIVVDTNYQQSGTPVLTANKSFILGYTQEDKGVYEDTPVIIFDDFTVDKKYVDFSFKVKSSAIKILKIKNKNNLKFVFEAMNLIRFDAQEHKRYYISAYQNLFIPLPKLKEQTAIADCLSSLDELITTQTQKTDALKAHKKGLMQKLFPAEGETLPKLRFPEFRDAGEWEEMRLGDVMEIIGGGTPKTNITEYWNGDIPWLSTPDFTNSNRWVYKSSKSITELGLKNSATKLLRQGDVIISARGTVGALAQLRKPMAFSQTNYGLRANPELINNAFFFYAIKENVKNLKRFSYGAVFDTITTKTFDQIDISLPSLSEQKAIADCLSSIDDLITAQTQKIDALKAHKKGLMQQLFPSH